MKFRSRTQRQEESEETAWISFSDLMTALLVVFMLATVIFVLSLVQQEEDLLQAQEEIEEAKGQLDEFDLLLSDLGRGERQRGDMVLTIQMELKQHGIDVDIDEASSVLHIPVDLLGFDSGSSDILPQFEESAVKIGEIIADVLVHNDQYQILDTVFVEGHTDDLPMSGVHGGNWGLSANRAISLWRLWEEELSVDLGSLQSTTGERLFSVSGYADTRPKNAEQTNDSTRAENRRIDIRFTEHKLSEEDLLKLRDETVSSEK